MFIVLACFAAFFQLIFCLHEVRFQFRTFLPVCLACVILLILANLLQCQWKYEVCTLACGMLLPDLNWRQLAICIRL